MAKSVTCDVCEKQKSLEECYELKLRKNDTGLTKILDICHGCVQTKGILDIFAPTTWKKWKSGKWSTPE